MHKRSVKKMKRYSHSNSSLSSLLSFIKDSITKGKLRSRRNKRKKPSNIITSEKIIWQQCDQDYLIKNLLRNLGIYGLVGLPNGDQYIGKLVNGLRHGSGIYLYESGAVYDGDWVNNMKHGTGAYYYKDGSKYIGDWLEDKRHGKGTYHYINGDIYEGSWVNHGRHGVGKYTYKDTQITYYGTWQENVRVATQNIDSTSNDEGNNQQENSEESNSKNLKNHLENLDGSINSPITNEIVVLINRLRAIISNEDGYYKDSRETISMHEDLDILENKPKKTNSFNCKPIKTIVQHNNLSLTNGGSQPNMMNVASYKNVSKSKSGSNSKPTCIFSPCINILSEGKSHDKTSDHITPLIHVSQGDHISQAKDKYASRQFAIIPTSKHFSEPEYPDKTNAFRFISDKCNVSENESQYNRGRLSNSMSREISISCLPHQLNQSSQTNAARLLKNTSDTNLTRISNSKICGAKISKADYGKPFNDVSQALFTKYSDFVHESCKGESKTTNHGSIYKELNFANGESQTTNHGSIYKEYLTENEESRLESTNSKFRQSDSRMARFNNVRSE